MKERPILMVGYYFSRSYLRVVLSRHPRIVNTGLLAGSVLITCVAVEFLFRALIQFADPVMTSKIESRIAIASIDDSARAYSPHPYLSYVPSDVAYEGDGIRIGKRHFSKRKPAGTIRVACLGGSTTMRKYPNHLEKDLARFSLGRNFEVMDFGCTGWTLAESAIDYAIRVCDFAPDIVLIHHGMNDSFPMIWPDFKPDYSHYRLSWRDRSGWLDRPFLARSWLLSYVQIRRGLRQTALRNYTVRPVNDRELSYAPRQFTLETYRLNLMNLISLIRANEGVVVLAPMAYKRGKLAEKYGPLIETQNECMRDAAREAKAFLAETDPILSARPGLFQDIVHASLVGIRIQSLLYAAAIWNAMQEPDIPFNADEIADVFLAEKSPAVQREIEIRWETGYQGIDDFHVYAYDEFSHESVYLGHAGQGKEGLLVWKANSPFVAKRFADGPSIGRTYRFQVYAVPANGDPPWLLPGDRLDRIALVNRYGSENRTEK